MALQRQLEEVLGEDGDKYFREDRDGKLVIHPISDPDKLITRMLNKALARYHTLQDGAIEIEGFSEKKEEEAADDWKYSRHTLNLAKETDRNRLRLLMCRPDVVFGDGVSLTKEDFDNVLKLEAAGFVTRCMIVHYAIKLG